MVGEVECAGEAIEAQPGGLRFDYDGSKAVRHWLLTGSAYFRMNAAGITE